MRRPSFKCSWTPESLPLPASLMACSIAWISLGSVIGEISSLTNRYPDTSFSNRSLHVVRNLVASTLPMGALFSMVSVTLYVSCHSHDSTHLAMKLRHSSGCPIAVIGFLKKANQSPFRNDSKGAFGWK